MLKNNKINILIALVAAIGLWLYVTGTINPNSTKKITNVEVQLINQHSLIQENLAVDNIEPAYVDITIAGPRSLLNSIEKEDIKATADVYTRFRGSKSVNIEVEVPKGIKVESKSSNKITVDVDQLVVEEKKIEAVLDGELKDGSVLGSVEIEPSTVKVFGTAGNIGKVVSVHAKLKSSKIVGSKDSQSATLEAVYSNGEKAKFISLSIDEAVVKTTIEKTKKVPLKVNVKGKDKIPFDIESIKWQELIEVRGEFDIIENLLEITSEDIDISEIRESVKIKIPIKLPEGIHLKKGSEEPYLSVILKNSASKSLEYEGEDISVENLSQGLKVDRINGKITLSLESTSGEKIDISKKDVPIYIDLTGRGIGEHTVNIQAKVDSKYTYKIQPERIKIRILEK